MVPLNSKIINGKCQWPNVNSPEVGKVNEDIDVQDVSGSDLVISFNPTYLIDALKALKSETVRVRFISPVRPFTLTPADDSENFIQLITRKETTHCRNHDIHDIIILVLS